jgi:hypothetical protein
MIIEQRRAPRRAVATDVLVNSENLDQSYPRLWKTRDLSLTGVFVELNGGGLTEGLTVEAVLMLGHPHKMEPHCVTADIARIAADGIALRFSRCEPRTREALEKMLNGAQVDRVI